MRNITLPCRILRIIVISNLISEAVLRVCGIWGLFILLYFPLPYSPPAISVSLLRWVRQWDSKHLWEVSWCAVFSVPFCCILPFAQLNLRGIIVFIYSCWSIINAPTAMTAIDATSSLFRLDLFSHIYLCPFFLLLVSQWHPELIQSSAPFLTTFFISSIQGG